MKKFEILLVEDNEGDIVLTAEAFEECQIDSNLNVVKNGKEALNYLGIETDQKPKNAYPDIILLDINLPLLNGHEVLYQIKNNEKTKHIPVIILTTSSASVDINKTYENYANCFITKPTDINDFFETIKILSKFWFQTVMLSGKN
ncbi:response regulator [Flavobacterium cucumis]|jgi:CheY-like chemotaxis protein|uniref:CheY chemotaxis protein or a CheY-like REC (Receiver) domain n=1 Tax=Flavobacterium cucumis TaxID=416016 RepID=A0A1M7ZWN2_9FLAO|nr:response regulator [Flavobacterium cucumis]SHO73213.1 CheY chemotaxis protein or a CheY-like REC (receiver) domain [Flavobacterium cucumis]